MQIVSPGMRPDLLMEQVQSSKPVAGMFVKDVATIMTPLSGSTTRLQANITPIAPSEGRPVRDSSSAAVADTLTMLLHREVATTATEPKAAARTVESLFADADADGNGELSQEEFQAFDTAYYPNKDQYLTEAATGRRVDGNYRFANADLDLSGLISLQEVKPYGYFDPQENASG